MTVRKIVNRAYPIIVKVLFLCIFSMIVSKFFIPKIILMSGEFPYPTEEYTTRKVGIVIAATLLLFALFFMYYKWVINTMKRTYTNIMIILGIIIILTMEIMITSIAFNPVVGDYAILKQGIVSVFNGDNQFLEMGQLLFYPYNTHIVLLGGYFAKLIGSVDVAIKILPIACITGSIILNVLIVRKITNFKVAHISIVLSVLNIFIYWQAPVFYTHTLVIFFISATMYTYLCLKTAETKRMKVTLWILLGIFAACTYIIRPTALAVALAILIENIFKFRKEYSVKVLSSVLFCLILIVSFKGITTKLNLSTDNEIEKIPFTHWVKMGLNKDTYGVWNQADSVYIDDENMKNTKDLDEHNKKVIVQRFNELGIMGYVQHLNEKITREWVSSQFSMYRIGEWFEQKNDTVTHYVSNYSTTNYKIITIYSYVIKLFVYIAFLAAIILYKKKDENESEVIRITIISTLGVFAFLLLWETAPHYTYEAFAFMNIPASLGLYKLFMIFNKEKQNV
ncbi:dolichyl-phosphate-mannose-mannosyltransferase family protein [Bacillus anthracis]|uniref:glycosyltransferase family 39 protein n=1 Tax=Bacillus anthracis TaxID=1392 RepID=UPI0001B414C0|nr:glycosyltransferase family 39 protein [Bacillus anthracis]AIK30245.1 dolichyl-phosphate-mannose-mannosyltransferase family protein [Bacillus anthracis]AJH87049.1 dolichyl-phosphate-mannose-mannosyltransferase family protein [Bacillus anthracis]KHA38308.1 membrane protein [Bacillus anthracis]UKX82843.1 glycosyltransferase family 39 protein [Bacillus anthracis]